MRWDLGIQGIGLLVVMSLGFGLIAQLVLWRVRTWWMWLVAAGAYFSAGVFVSEVWFGWATQEELQPNIDGLSFDEVLLLTTLMGVTGLLLARYLTRRSRRRPRREGKRHRRRPARRAPRQHAPDRRRPGRHHHGRPVGPADHGVGIH
jgi:hypothetical protein